MKKLLLSALLLLTVSTMTVGQATPKTPSDTTKTKSKEQMVYVCMGGSAYAYHTDKSCRFLANCSKKIERVAVSKAIEMGRKPCKSCNGR